MGNCCIDLGRFYCVWALGMIKNARCRKRVVGSVMILQLGYWRVDYMWEVREVRVSEL